MTYSLSCRDLGIDDDFNLNSRDKDVLIDEMINHAMEEHSEQMQEMISAMSMDEIRSVFREAIRESV